MWLLVDLDHDVKPEDLAKRVKYLEKVLGFKLELRRSARTTKGWHFYFEPSAKLSDVERLAVQLLLGDDWRRGAYCLSRIRAGALRWNVLFEEKYNGKGELLSKEEEDLGFFLRYHIAKRWVSP